jgi:hypothetical protein
VYKTKLKPPLPSPASPGPPFDHIWLVVASIKAKVAVHVIARGAVTFASSSNFRTFSCF